MIKLSIAHCFPCFMSRFDISSSHVLGSYGGGRETSFILCCPYLCARLKYAPAPYFCSILLGAPPTEYLSRPIHRIPRRADSGRRRHCGIRAHSRLGGEGGAHSSRRGAGRSAERCRAARRPHPRGGPGRRLRLRPVRSAGWLCLAEVEAVPPGQTRGWRSPSAAVSRAMVAAWGFNFPFELVMLY